MKARLFRLVLSMCMLGSMVTGCSVKAKAIDQTQRKGGAETAQSPTSDNMSSKYRKVQLDFNGHSPEGGLIFAYYEGEALTYFEVYLFGERGKVEYRFGNETHDRVSVLRTEYTYDKSIGEGDVKVVSQKEERLLIENDKQYKVDDGGNIEQSDRRLIRLYKQALQTVSEQKG